MRAWRHQMLDHLNWRLWNEGSPLITYLPNLLDRSTASDVFAFCQEHVKWKREVDDFGPQERLSYFVGEPGCSFAYVGLFLKPEPWPQPVLQVRDALNAVLRSAKLPEVTACLMNQYEPGQGQIVWHRDEIRAHGPDPVIVSVSLCPDGERNFDIRYNSTQHVQTQKLAHGSAMFMAGKAAQNSWMHRLPLVPDAAHRISLTFRSIVPGLEDARHQLDSKTTSRAQSEMDDCVSV